MVRLLLLLSLLLSYAASAQEYVLGEGRFTATSEDSLGFVKKQVIHQGFMDVITKELESMGLNKDLFWQKYNEKFASSFEATENNLKAKFKIGTGEESVKQKEIFAKQLRVKKLKRQIRFGNLDRVIQSYVIKRYSRSQQNPNARYVRLEAKVNRNMLSKIYYNYIRGKRSSDYGSLFLNIKYNLVKTSYSDLGVEKGKDFTEVVNGEWLNWFSKNKPANIANIEVLEEDKLKRLQSYFKLPYERMMQEIPEVFVNSLYLELIINIEKVGENEKFKEYEFSFSGGGYLLDLQSNKVLSTIALSQEIKKYRNLEYNKLSTVLANHVYRMPIAQFTDLKSTIKDIPPLNSIHRVSLYDFHNMGEVDELISLVHSRGIKYSLSARLESIGTNRAELVVFMDGELTDLKTLLSSLKSAKKGLSFDFIDTDNILGVKFNKVQEESKVRESPQG